MQCWGPVALKKKKETRTMVLLAGQRTNEQLSQIQMVATDCLMMNLTLHWSQTNLIQMSPPHTGQAVQVDKVHDHTEVGGNQVVPPMIHQTLQSLTTGMEDPRDLPTQLDKITKMINCQGTCKPTSCEDMTVSSHTQPQPWAGKASPSKTH